MASLADLYAASSVSSAGTRASARGSAGISSGIAGTAAVRRRKLLQDAVTAGTIKPQQLGVMDRSLLAAAIPSHHGGGFEIADLFSKPANFLGNLGSDIYTAAKYMPAGFYNTGKAVLQDVFERSGVGPHSFSDSHVNKEVVKPTLQSYGETYGHGPGHFFQSFYQHPLGPILDAASVASVGLSSAARLGRAATGVAEPGSTLARVAESAQNLTSREGRPGIVRPADANMDPAVLPEVTHIQRDYTPRPLSKLGQRAIDRLGTLGDPEKNPIARTQWRSAQRSWQKEQYGLANVAKAERQTEALNNLRSFTHLDEDEATALTLSLQGLNTPEKLRDAQAMWRANRPDDHLLKARNIEPAYLDRLQNLSPRVEELIQQPTDKMHVAAEDWAAEVERQKEELGIPHDTWAEYMSDPVRMVEEHRGDRFGQQTAAEAQWHALPESERNITPRPERVREDVGEGQITPDFVPPKEGNFFKKYDPGFLNKMVPDALHERLGIRDTSWNRGLADRPENTWGVTAQTLFTGQGSSPYSFGRQGEIFSEGTFRTDARQYLESAAEQIRDQADRALNQETLQRFAAKDENGELLRVTNQREAEKLGFASNQWTVVNDDMPIAWAHTELDVLEQVNKTIDNLRDTGKLQDSPELSDLNLNTVLDALVDQHAQDFVQSHWQAFKRKGVIVPTEVADYSAAFAKLNMPFDNAAARFMARWLHRWRTFTLTYMPRWAFNTAVGSFLMNTIRGVTPMDYMRAVQLKRAGEVPGGVSLSHQPMTEVMEAANPGWGKATESAAANYAAQMGIPVATKMLLNFTQGIEDFFRRGAFVHNLRREQQLKRAEQGRRVDIDHPEGMVDEDINNVPATPEEDAAVENIGNTLKDHYERVLSLGDVRNALADPETVTRSIHETNKLAYNYNILGPFERRYIRQLVPFWGWYKFISMAAWRLPVEFPGRSNVLRWQAEVAKEQEDEMGGVPQWLEGAIPISFDGKNYTYLSSMGINPFGSIFNPLSPQGPVAGAFTLGQFNPVIQAGLSAAGYDTLSNDMVRMSPEEGVGRDFIGRMYDAQGQTSAIQHGAGRRFVMGLLRSVPQVRLGEQLYEGGNVYPESVPVLADRPMPPSASGPPTATDTALGYLGVRPRSYDVKRFQELEKKSTDYVMKRTKKARLKAQRQRSGQ
jgi:hypothetical protein